MTHPLLALGSVGFAIAAILRYNVHQNDGTALGLVAVFLLVLAIYVKIGRR